PLNASTGDTINLYLPNDYNFDNTKETIPIKMNYVGSIESKYLIGMNRFGYYNNLTLIVSEDFYLQNQDSIKVDASMVNILLNLDKNQNKEIAIKRINNYVTANNADFLQEKDSEIEFNMKIKSSYPVIYTGLVLLTLISSINLMNIRSMNMSLREKEFKILLSIGMKKSKLNKIIFLEGIVAWFISSVIGGSISIIVLTIIKIVYMYQGYLQDTAIPIHIISVYIIMLFLITIIISIVPYRKLKNIELNNLTKDNE
ncbi:MAG: FtsX-like permease family protein, partial [Peptostreptococcaceae bacterium]